MPISKGPQTPTEVRSPHQSLAELEDLVRTLATLDDNVEESWSHPGNFWNPGPATLRENLKLKILHAITVGSGCFRPLFGRLATSTFGVLTYHRITECKLASRDSRVTEPSINVSPRQFYRQLSGLKKQGFHFCTLDEILTERQRVHDSDTTTCIPQERMIAVTFDDIYDNVFHNAWPVLQELDIPATVFISTAFPDSSDPFPFDHWARHFFGDIPMSDWRPIQERHLEEMLSSDLIHLGAHTHTHQDFRKRPDDFALDLQQGIQQLQDRYGQQPLPFAFPYGVPRLGFANEKLMEHVRNSELTCGLTTGGHTNSFETSPFGWGRFHVFEHDSAASLAAKLDGYYEWLPTLKNSITSALKK